MKLRCLLVLFFLAVPFACLAAAAGASAGSARVVTSGENHGHSKEVVDDFLLFWEEKDLYVEAPTRNIKPISQVAENITVVTAKDIEDMNAHTVAEVLNRVTGVFVDFSGQDFGSDAQIHIQSSIQPSYPERHVLVLLDGIEWNLLNGGQAETGSIPVGIIDRIEVIKGPASSSWGSSLGGVINIVTKAAGSTPRPAGTLRASYGEGNSQDYRAEVAGKAGSVGYYFYAGRQDSDGLSDSREFKDNSLYTKFSIPVSRDITLGLTVGYSDPHLTSFALPPPDDFISRLVFRTFFATATLDASISRELRLNVSLRRFDQKAEQLNDVLTTGEMIQNNISKEETTSGSVKLVWGKGLHTAVFGIDGSHGSGDQSLEGFVSSTPHSTIDKWAVFANDTMSLCRFSITPGIRYDHNNITGSFTSPSLGATYEIAERTIARFSVARGFTIPPLSWTSGGGYYLNPNPELESERVWAYQAGLESGVSNFLWIKATVFYNTLKDALEKVPADLKFYNVGGIIRRGFEIEGETVPYHGLSFKGGFAYVHTRTSTKPEFEYLHTTTPVVPASNAAYEYNLAVKYEDKGNLMVQLFGHYSWWNMNNPQFDDPLAKYNDFIWDLNVRKWIFAAKGKGTEIFFTGHNLFNGSQYTVSVAENPKRWVEGGLKFSF